MARVLVVAAHPDDEVLGCGGAVARHAALGDEVESLILAEGATARGTPADQCGALKDAARAAASVLGAAPPRFLELPDNRLDSLDLLDIIQRIEAVVEEVRPDMVLTHHGGDLNVDHRITHRAVLTACRPLPGGSITAIHCFETVSSSEWGAPFNPTRFVDISAVIDRKIAALECYAAEMRPFPHARSIQAVRALATVRGASVGRPAAEAFMTVRQVIG